MPLIFEIDSKLFKSNYSVYIIEVINNSDRFYYIGQTGDSHYLTARSPLRRLIGHLSDSKASTENQIYKYVAKKILPSEKKESKKYSTEEKEMIENYFIQSDVKMYSYPLIDFDFHASEDNHQKKTKRIVEFEKQVILLFKDSGKSLINKQIPKKIKNQIEFTDVYNEIKDRFELIPAHNKSYIS
jgi:hypothetical protein